MNQLYKGQSNVKIELETGVNLAGHTNAKILVVNPDKTKQVWEATIEGSKISYELQSNNLNQVGTYNLQAYCENGGRKSYGDRVNLLVQENNS